MALGAVFGALNTMYSAVSERSREIAMLRAIGFGGGSIVLSFVVESLLIALVGGVVGCLAVLPVNGLTTGTINWQTFSHLAFAFRITPGLLLAGMVFALLMGLLGGLPAGGPRRPGERGPHAASAVAARPTPRDGPALAGRAPEDASTASSTGRPRQARWRRASRRAGVAVGRASVRGTGGERDRVWGPARRGSEDAASGRSGDRRAGPRGREHAS